MKATFLAVRAIGAEYARGLWWPVAIGAGIGAAILIALQLWLASLNAWWWLLMIPISILLSVAIILLGVFFLLIRYVRPQQDPHQKKRVKAFVEKLSFASELAGTPKFIILFRVIRSIAAPSSEPYLQQIVESKDLATDFRKIVGLFGEK